MKTYRAVCFDLFGTIVQFDAERFPEVSIRGEHARTTLGETYAVLRGFHPEIGLEDFERAWREANEAIRESKSRDLQEVNSVDRFLFRKTFPSRTTGSIAYRKSKSFSAGIKRAGSGRNSPGRNPESTFSGQS